MNKAAETGVVGVTGYRRPYFNTQPPYAYPGYRSTLLRAPTRPLVILPHTLSEVTGPVFGYADVQPTDSDLTRQHDGEPIGERIVVSGRVLDENSRPVAHALVEVWQANAAGRYRHAVDDHDAPLDPNFTGAGRAHLHFSLFGLGLVQRLVTQMYFPGDPLIEYDPMYNSVPDEKARRRMVSSFDWEATLPDIALAFRYDIVLRGRDATPMESSRS